MKRKSANRHPGRILCAVLILGLSSAWTQTLKTPIVKTGDCPTLTRRSFILPHNYQGNTIQNELTPAQSINCLETAPGFKAELWASETDTGNIKALMYMTFDERGRVWAVETFDYPNTKTAPFAGHDRVVILEDTDGDGVMDKHTVFVTGLNMPQSIELTPQGVLVAMAPSLVLFKDEDGDDRADNPQGTILYTGFGNGDTHFTCANLHYGLDNWIYGTFGSEGIIHGTNNTNRIIVGKDTVRLANTGTWRCRPDGSKFEWVASVMNNSWGMGQGEDGQIFCNSANGDHSRHAIFADRSPAKSSANMAASGRGPVFYPITSDVNQYDYQGRFTAGSGHDIYTSRLFPREYWNRAAFVTEGTGHLVNQDFLDPVGSTWKVTSNANARNLIASKDAWTAPIVAKTGPDGAVWVLDWNNYLFLHNPGSPIGAGGAVISELRTKKSNRIYRIVPADGRLEPILNLANATLPELVATFRNPNFLWRLQAQRLLIRKGRSAELEGLLDNALLSRDSNEIGNDPICVHALWTLQGLGLLESSAAKYDPILKRLLLHPSPSVRRNVLLAMPRTAASGQAIKDQGRVNDPNPHVRLQALMALAKMPGGSGASVWVDYRNTDSWSQQAFDSAQAVQAAGLPAIPALERKVVTAVADLPGKPCRAASVSHRAAKAFGYRSRMAGWRPAGCSYMACRADWRPSPGMTAGNGPPP